MGSQCNRELHVNTHTMTQNNNQINCRQIHGVGSDALRSVSVVGGAGDGDDDENMLMELMKMARHKIRICTYEKNKSQKQTLASCSLLGTRSTAL